MEEQKTTDSTVQPATQPPGPVPATINPNQIYPTPDQIYPTATHEVGSEKPGNVSPEQAKLLSNSELEMRGLRVNHGAPKSKEVDIVGILIVISGVVSLTLGSKHPINIAYDAVYIVIGVGILTRSEMARKIVVFVSVIGLLFNILALFAISATTTGKRSVLLILSTLFSIVVQVAVLSILTWHQNEKEFR